MPLKPWYKIVTPREDLREGKPLDASEFAVLHDHVREGRDQRFWLLANALSELYPGHPRSGIGVRLWWRRRRVWATDH